MTAVGNLMKDRLSEESLSVVDMDVKSLVRELVDYADAISQELNDGVQRSFEATRDIYGYELKSYAEEAVEHMGLVDEQRSRVLGIVTDSMKAL